MVVRDLCKAVTQQVFMYQTIAPACVLIVALCATAVLPDASVVQSGSPTFPLQVDKAKLIIYRESAGKKADSLTLSLPVSLYAELRDNIDTVFTYADALRNRRQELSGCRGKADGRWSCLTFEYMGLTVLRVFFSCNGYKSGKLAAAVDRYPFVVVLSKGFSTRLKKLIKTGPR
jgi:hypothetical protein